MASSSNMSVQKKSFKYDVFLSFRGEDTRNTFVDHLYQALNQKGIQTYKDDDDENNIKQGKMISDELIKAIEDSKIYIIVFSKNYVSSSWCLDELVKIMECNEMTDHTAWPVFYGVEPTEVRNQSGPVGEAFDKHRNEEASWKWREALKKAADLPGLELTSTLEGQEGKLVNEIVQEISLEVRFNKFGFDEKFIGMKARVRDFISSLEVGSDEVRMIGIWGMGGGGKTTLVRAVFDLVSADFEAKSFVENVREVSKGSMFGLKYLQEQVLSNVLNEHVTVNGVTHGQYVMKERMREKKVLLVLDDVDHIEQLEALAGDPGWFKPGSRILITTRDKQVLVAHRVHVIHDIVLLSMQEANSLFSRYAFGRRENPLQGYEELSEKVVSYAAGLPLTLKILGSFLCGKDMVEWEDAIDRLNRVPLRATLEDLELSYDSLEEDYKEIFLDIACILKGETIENAIGILECCGFYARHGLRVLEQKSLITISEDGVLGMHDHIEEMGKNIVRREHPDEPNKHSRLWIDEEIEDILDNDMGSAATRYLKFKTSGGNSRVLMKGLRKMKKLRYLELNIAFYDFESDAECLDDTSQYFPNSLKYLRSRNYPFSILPNTFQGKYLGGIDILGGKIVQLWKDGAEKVLSHLRFLTIGDSKLRTFDLRLAPNLEQLTISNCKDFVELHIPADHYLKLENLDLSYNYKLTNLHLGKFPNLKKLKLNGCGYLVELEMPSESLKLEHLDLSYNSWLTNLHLANTPNLKTIILEDCENLVLLPELGRVKCLKELNIRNTGIRRLPQSILQLKGLCIIGSTEIFESYGLTYKIQTAYKGKSYEETFGVFES